MIPSPSSSRPEPQGEPEASRGATPGGGVVASPNPGRLPGFASRTIFLNPRRNKAFLIDSLLCAGFMAGPLFLAEQLPEPLARSLVIGGIATSLFYSIFRDGFRGQSIGKRIFHVRIVHSKTGKPIGFGMAFLRGFLTCFPFLGWMDFILIAFTLDGQRLTDKILRTELEATDLAENSPESRLKRDSGYSPLYKLLGIALVILTSLLIANLAPHVTLRARKLTANGEKMAEVGRYLHGYQKICDRYPLSSAPTQTRVADTSLGALERAPRARPSMDGARLPPHTPLGLHALSAPMRPPACNTPNPTPLMQKYPLDPWGQEYRYTSDGKTFVLESEGEPESQRHGRAKILRLEDGWEEPREVEK